MMKRTNFLLTAACFILISSDFCVPPIHGLRCYRCKGCKEGENGVDCDSGLDRCSFAEQKDGTIIRDCSAANQEQEDAKKGIKCDEFHDVGGFRKCYCDTDLCNGNNLLNPAGPSTSGSGHTEGHYPIFIAVFVSTYVSGRYAY